MKKQNMVLTALAVLLVLGASIGAALAYFTTYVEAKGGVTINLGYETTITEPQMENWTKHVVIGNEGPSACYVRARAFAPDGFTLDYSQSAGWEQQGDYYYYTAPLNAGESTSELLIKIDNIPEDVKNGDSFNVPVIYESVPVLYDEDGSPIEDWDQQVDLIEEGGQS